MKPDRKASVWADIEVVAREQGARLSLVHALIADVRALSAVGASVSLSRGDGELNEPILGTGPEAEALEELQYTLGDGPCRDTVGMTGPVLVADLAGVLAAQRWPVFASAATERGVRGMFVFPMRIGAARLGTLSVYREQAGMLDAGELANGLVFADAATVLALDGRAAADMRLVIDTAFTLRRAEVHQAAGMVAADLEMNVADALVLLRGHAYGTGRGLYEVAADVVAGRLRLAPDGLGSPGTSHRDVPEPDQGPG